MIPVRRHTARRDKAQPKRAVEPIATQSTSEKSGYRDANGRLLPGHPYRWQAGKSANPGGRPKTHKELETFIQEVLAEPIAGKADMTRLKLMLHAMTTSKSAGDHATILEHGYGKVTQPIDVSLSDELRRLLAGVPEADQSKVKADLIEIFGQDVVVSDEVAG